MKNFGILIHGGAGSNKGERHSKEADITRTIEHAACNGFDILKSNYVHTNNSTNTSCTAALHADAAARRGAEG